MGTQRSIHLIWMSPQPRFSDPLVRGILKKFRTFTIFRVKSAPNVFVIKFFKRKLTQIESWLEYSSAPKQSQFNTFLTWIDTHFEFNSKKLGTIRWILWFYLFLVVKRWNSMELNNSNWWKLTYLDLTDTACTTSFYITKYFQNL